MVESCRILRQSKCPIKTVYDANHEPRPASDLPRIAVVIRRSDRFGFKPTPLPRGPWAAATVVAASRRPFVAMNQGIGSLVTQVWRIDLSVSSVDLRRAGLDDSILDHEESRRAKAFKFDRDRDRFIRAHVALRRLLSSVTDIDANQLSMRLDDRGKPTLMPNCGVQFNLSHSEDQALVAISRTARIGVDLEKIRPLSDADALAERHFSQRECAHLRTLPVGVARERAFFHCWTRKEAFVKCTGVGLRTDLRRIESGFSGDIVVDGVLIRSLPVVDAFAAAIAIEGKPGTVEFLDYRDTSG